MNKNKMLYTYIKIEIMRFLREPVSLFFTLIFPIVLIYIFGDSFGNTTSESTGQTYYNSLVSIDVAFLIANFTLMGIGNDLANQKDLGITINMNLLPIKKWEKTLVQSAAYLIILFISTIILTGYVYMFYTGINFKGNLIIFIVFLVLSYFVFVSITKFIVTLNFSARTIQLISSSIFFILLFTSGIVISKESLPNLIQGVVDFSPLYVVYHVLESVWNDTISAKELALNSAYSIIIIAVFNLLSKRKIIKNG